MQTNTTFRIHEVDALRGFALMGLFMVHMVSFFGLHWIEPIPSFTFDAVSWTFGGKAYALFALLFGFSFFLIMNGQEKRGNDFRKRFSWRMLLLFLLGYIHSLIYASDILQVLAVAGLVLVGLYRVSNTILLLLSLFFILNIPTFGFLYYLSFSPEAAASTPTFWGYTAVSNNVAATGGFIELIKANAFQSHFGKWWLYIETARLWNILGLSMLGFWLGRIGFFSAFEKFTKAHLIVAIFGVVFAYATVLAGDYINQDPPQQSMVYWTIGTIIWSYMAAGLLMAFTFVLVMGFKVPVVSKFLKLLEPCGRMSLTLYIGQSFLFAPIFYGYGLGLYNSMSHNEAVLWFIVFWIAQMIFANYWFKYFQYGPLEWLWRAGTFTRLDVPFRARTAK